VHGVQSLQPGQDLTVYLDPAHVYLFSDEGALVAAAPYAEAA
jgi:glycerol transport system ATP-binding protein